MAGKASFAGAIAPVADGLKKAYLDPRPQGDGEFIENMSRDTDPRGGLRQNI